MHSGPLPRQLGHVAAAIMARIEVPAGHKPRPLARTDEEGGAAGHPLVRAILRALPGSTFVDVRTRFIDE